MSSPHSFIFIIALFNHPSQIIETLVYNQSAYIFYETTFLPILQYIDWEFVSILQAKNTPLNVIYNI